MSESIVYSKCITIIKEIEDAVEKMSAAKEKAMGKDSVEKIAKAFDEDVKGYFDKIRSAADLLESLVDDKLWKLPKYRELLFVK